MMSRRFSDAQNYYQRMKELQEKLKQSEDERMKLEKKFNKILQTCRAEERIRKLSSAKDNYFQLLDEDRLRSDRNDSLMQILDRIENRACSINAKTERLRLLRKHYEAYMERTYPGWKANESRFYESYNEKLKAINSHFRTLSNDYTEIPTWKTSSEIDVSRDDFSSTPAYSVVNFPQASYSNTSSFNLPDQNPVKSNIKTSDSLSGIYNNYGYTQLPREPSIHTPTTSTYNKEASPLGKSMSFKTSSYNLSNPTKSTFTTNYSKPASIVSDFDTETFQLNNDISYSRTNPSDMDLDKDFNTKSDYYTNDPLDRTANNSLLNSYSPRFSRYDSSRQSLKYNYNPISPVVKYSNHYSRPSSYAKNYIPKSLTRSASLDTFTTKYSPRYRYQNSTMPTPYLYTGEKLFRSSSLDRIPQESGLSISSTKPADSYDYGGGYYKKYSPRTRFSERKNYSTLSPIYTSNRIPSDAGYFSHRSTSPANSSTYSSYNAAGSRYNTPRLTRSNSIQKNYEPPYTSTAPKRSVTSNLPYMSTLSRSQSFSEIDDLDYLSRKKNYDMSGWSQYPMGRERFYYDNRNSTNYPASPYTNQYRASYSPEPSYNPKSYSFQADKSTSTDDGYDEDKTTHGKRMNRVHYADTMNMNNSTLDYNNYITERASDNNPITYDRDLYPQRPIDEFKRNTDVASEMTVPSQRGTDILDRKKVSTKEEPDRTSSNEAVIKNGSLDEFRSPTTLPYSQQVLQTLEERTEEDITQSTSENPSLGSEQHWENEIGKLKDIMNYDSQPDSFAPGVEKDHRSYIEPHSYYNQSGRSPTATDSLVKPMDAQTGGLNKTKENSGFAELPDLKQEIEMLKKKSPPQADDSNGFKQEQSIIHPNSTNDYPNPSVKLDDQHLKQPPSSDYNAYTAGVNIGDIPREQKVPLNSNSQPAEYMMDYTNSKTQRVSPSHDLEESQVLEKQDQPEKYDKKYNEVRASDKEFDKSPITSLPRQISPVLQATDGRENAQGKLNERQKAKENLPVQESTNKNLKDIGHEQNFPRSLQTISDKSPQRSQFNIDNSNMYDNQPIGNTNYDMIQPSNGVKPGTALVNTQNQADKMSKILHPPSPDKLNLLTNPSIGISKNTSRVNNQNEKSGQQIQPDKKTHISSENRESFPLENAQRATADNQNTFQKQNAEVKYEHTQPSLQTMQEDDNRQKTEDIQKENPKHQSPQNISQDYQPQQQLYKNGAPKMQPINSEKDIEHSQQPLTQTPQQLGDGVSPQQPVIQSQQQYEQPQYQNYEEKEPYDQYNYDVTGGDAYQPQYDNTNAYQYNEDQIVQQYPDNQPQQEYQEPQYPQQEQYPQAQNGQYPQAKEGQYNPQQEGQYPQEHEGQYPQQQEGQYPQQQDGQYPQQQDGQYPQQQDDQYPQQQDGQYPQQQDDQYPQHQEDQYPQQQGDQYPQPHEVQYSQQQMGSYPPQQDQQYPPQYSEDNMKNNQIPIQRQYPEGQVPEQFPENPIEQQYPEDTQPYTGEQSPQQYMQGQDQQPYQDGQYAQQYDDGQAPQHYSNEQYNNYQQDNTAYPENYYEQQQGYQGYNEQAQEHYQQNPDQYNATKPEEQLYSEGQVDDKDYQPKDQNQPTEQVLPSAGNYDEHQVEPLSVPIPEQQLAEKGSTDALPEQQDMESSKLKEDSQKEVLKVEPEKSPSPGSNTVESDKKGAVKNANSPKHDDNIANEPAPAAPGDKSATGTSKPTAGSKVNEKAGEGKTEVGATTKQTPAAPSRGEKPSESSAGTAKGTTRAVEKKGDAGGKASSAAKTADSKPSAKTKAGEKVSGVKGAATARTALNKAQK